MQESPFKFRQTNIAGACDITFAGPLATLSLGKDDMLINFNHQTQQLTERDLHTQNHYNCICALPESKIAIGGEARRVELTCFQNTEDKELVYEASGTINDIVYCRGRDLLGIASEEKAAVVVDMETKKFRRCKPGHSAGVLSVAFSQCGKYLSSCGTDGYLKVFKLDQAIPEEVDSLLISKETRGQPHNFLRCSWSDKMVIALAGAPFLQVLVPQEDKFILKKVSQVVHSKSISICHWLPRNLLATVGLDNLFKLWDYTKKECLLKHEFTDPIYRVVSDGLALALIDSKGFSYHHKYNPPAEQSQRTHQYALRGQVNLRDEQEEQEQGQEADEGEEAAPEVLGRLDKVIDVLPQDILLPGETELVKGRKYLLWNAVGVITQREAAQAKFAIDVEFAEKDLHRAITVLAGEVRCAALGFKNLALGLGEDKETEQPAVLRVTAIDGSKEQWQFRLPEGETADCVAIGNQFTAFISSENVLRVFNHFGFLLAETSFQRNIVALLAYENMLVLVYHEGVPLCGMQTLSMRWLRVEGRRLTLHLTASVALSPYSKLRWAAFSEEGLLVTQDSKQVVRVFVGGLWHVVHRSKPGETLYPICMQDYELQGVLLGTELEPPVLPRPVPRTVRPAVTLPETSQLRSEEGKGLALSSLLWRQLVVEHKRERLATWGKYSLFRQKDDFLHRYSESILTEDKLAAEEQQVANSICMLIFSDIQKLGANKALSIIKSFVHVEKELQRAVKVFERTGLYLQKNELERFIASEFKFKSQGSQQQDIQQASLLAMVRRLIDQAFQKENLKDIRPLVRTFSHEVLPQPDPPQQARCAETSKGSQPAVSVNPFAKDKQRLNCTEEALRALREQRRGREVGPEEGGRRG